METLWSNADAVVEFLEQHRERRYVVGDYVVLPDIGQRYDVVAVRPFRRDGRLFMFLDLEAVCAVEGCGSVFRTDMEVNRWRKGRKLRRCCPEHQWRAIKFWALQHGNTQGEVGDGNTGDDHGRPLGESVEKGRSVGWCESNREHSKNRTYVLFVQGETPQSIGGACVWGLCILSGR